jgi:hypothetical protein
MEQPPSRTAERMRLYRKRRREGVRLVQVTLQAADIDELVRLEVLEPEQRANSEALSIVALHLIHLCLEEIRCSRFV